MEELYISYLVLEEAVPQGGAEYGERNDERTDTGYIPALDPKEPEYGKSICASQVRSSVISEKITVSSIS